mmetsp:Transcript_92918/g.239994  ORF Transcript_92918/g.239994 Transcript_92918/m.239994 type:complete len:83 (-) Transcript_92918:31-279(-)
MLPKASVDEIVRSFEALRHSGGGSPRELAGLPKGMEPSWWRSSSPKGRRPLSENDDANSARGQLSSQCLQAQQKLWQLKGRD